MIKSAATALILLTTMLSIWPSSVLAQAQRVFKCIDRDNQVAFQDKPCAAGLHQQQVAIAPAPPSASSPDTARPSPRDASDRRTGKGSPRQKVVYSFACHTQSGALFYRHNRCPASIDRSGWTGGRHSATREPVSAQRITRLDACRGMRSVGRDGREFDEALSTYERNLGRDPCRKY